MGVPGVSPRIPPGVTDGRGSARRRHSQMPICVVSLLVGLRVVGELFDADVLAPTVAPPAAFLGGGLPRRDTLALGAVLGAGTLGAAGGAQPAHAFKNRVEKLRNEQKIPGKKPDDIGVYARKEGAPPDLKGCSTSPNCFSSASTYPESYLEPWRFSKGGSTQAFGDLLVAVEAYKPGQRGVDGGGFQVQETKPESGYLYVQFESLKKGYKDDVEFLVRADASGDGGEVRVRSASRQGLKDLGVNAKRLNGIAEGLQKLEGWSAPLLTNDRFPEYVRLNQDESFGQTGPKVMKRGENSLFSVISDANKAR